MYDMHCDTLAKVSQLKRELKRDRIEIHALKIFLGDFFCNHIQSEFPEVVMDDWQQARVVPGKL